MASVCGPWAVNNDRFTAPLTTAASSHKTTTSQSNIENAAHAAFSTSQSESSPIRHKHPPRNIVSVPELHEESKKAKKLEWKLTLQAMIKGFTDSFEGTGISSSSFSIDACREVFSQKVHSREVYIEQRISRMLLSLHAIHCTPIGTDFVEKTKTLVNTLTCGVRRLDYESTVNLLKPYFNACGLEGNSRLLSQHASEIYFELYTCFYYHNSFQDKLAEFTNDVMAVAELLLQAPHYLDQDPKSYAKATLLALRTAFTSPAYLLMRCDESNPSVRMLHAVALSGFANAETVRSYLQLGKAIYDKADIKRHQSFASLLDATREYAANAGFPEDDPEVSTTSRVRDLVAETLSSWRSGVSVFQVFKAAWNNTIAYFYEPYKDYRLGYNNLPGVLCEESFSTKNAEIAMRVVLSPSPAQGSRVLPEFSALLQAIENRRLDPKGKYLYPYKQFRYTNMQNRFAGPGGQQYSEELQTRALMHLNDRYPSVFRAITLAVDPLQNCNTFDESMKKRLVELLLSDNTFTLDNPTSQDSKYYFPPQERQMWSEVLPEIVNNAFELLTKSNLDDAVKIKLFVDIINLGIIRYFETLAVAESADLGEDTKVLSSRNCAVCIDRGGKVNGQMLHLLDKKALLVIEIMIARSILDKSRLLLKKRSMELTSVTHHGTLTNTLRGYLANMLALASEELSSLGITYPGCTPEELPIDPPSPAPVAARKKLNF